MKSRFMFVVVSLLVVAATLLSACGGAATPAPAPTQAPKAAEPTKAPAAAPTKAPEPTKAPTAAPTKAPEVKVNNPPKTADEVDAIDLKGKNVTITYWHNRPQKDQDFMQGMLDEFNKSNPYGITAKAEIAGAS